MNMTLDETLNQLKALGTEKVRKHNAKYGAGENQFGAKHGDMRMLAKKIGSNDDLRDNKPRADCRGV